LRAVQIVPIGKGTGLAAERKEPISVCNLQTDSSGDARPGAKATGMEGGRPIFHGIRRRGAPGPTARRVHLLEETALLTDGPRHLIPMEIMNNDNPHAALSLKSSAVAAGSAALLPAQSPNDTVRVAFIGASQPGPYAEAHMLKVPAWSGRHLRYRSRSSEESRPSRDRSR
jgi:hypothetical protein